MKDYQDKEPREAAEGGFEKPRPDTSFEDRYGGATQPSEWKKGSEPQEEFGGKRGTSGQSKDELTEEEEHYGATEEEGKGKTSRY